MNRDRDIQITPFKLSNDETVWIEVQEVPIEADEDEIKLVSRSLTDQERPFQKALEHIRPAAAAVFSALREINTPNRIEMEIGIGFSGKIGAFIASADSNATFKIKLTWENPPPKPTP